MLFRANSAEEEKKNEMFTKKPCTHTSQELIEKGKDVGLLNV